MADFVEKEDSRLVFDLGEVGISVRKLVKRLDELGWENLEGEIQQDYNRLKGKDNPQIDHDLNQYWRASWVGDCAFAGNSVMPPKSCKYDFRPILYHKDGETFFFPRPNRIDYIEPLSALEQYLRKNIPQLYA